MNSFKFKMSSVPGRKAKRSWEVSNGNLRLFLMAERDSVFEIIRFDLQVGF